MTLKTQPTDASVEAFIDTVEDEGRRQDCRTVLEIMTRVTGEAANMWGDSIVGLGSYRYRYASGREGDWFLVGFAPRKRDLTLYIMPGFDRYGELMEALGKHKTGRSCLYIKRLADIDLRVLEQLVEASVRYMRETYPS
jgi:hypothetical protein